MKSTSLTPFASLTFAEKVTVPESAEPGAGEGVGADGDRARRRRRRADEHRAAEEVDPGESDRVGGLRGEGDDPVGQDARGRRCDRDGGRVVVDRYGHDGGRDVAGLVPGLHAER